MYVYLYLQRLHEFIYPYLCVYVCMYVYVHVYIYCVYTKCAHTTVYIIHIQLHTMRHGIVQPKTLLYSTAHHLI